MLPGGGYSAHAPHEAEPIVEWLEGWAFAPACSATRGSGTRCRSTRCGARSADAATAAHRIGLVGFSAGGHLAGLAALAPSSDERETVGFVVMGYAITSMETETYRPSQIILLGEHATPQARRETSLDALVTPSAPPFFIWHTAEDIYVPPEHTYRFAQALAANDVAAQPCTSSRTDPTASGSPAAPATRRSGRHWRRRGSPSGSPRSSRKAMKERGARGCASRPDRRSGS